MIRLAETFAVQQWANADPHGYHDATEPLQDLDAIATDLPDVLKERRRQELTLHCLRSAAEIEAEKARTRMIVAPNDRAAHERWRKAEAILLRIREAVRS